MPCSREPEPGSYADIEVSASLTGLTPATTYHFRIVAANVNGTTESKDRSFLTLGGTPVVTGVNPKHGWAGGGETVTITGNRFIGASAVQFGSFVAPKFFVRSAKVIVATSPSGEEARTVVDVTVTTPGGTSPPSSADQFRFEAPGISGVVPNSGSIEGNNSVTVSGTGFGLGSEATLFKFGKTTATTVNCTSSTSCTVTVPPHSAEIVNVKAVVNGQGSRPTQADQYTYE